jgi:hypothetical protein
MSRSHTNQARLHLRTNPNRIRGISRAIERTYVTRAKFPFVGLGLADYRQRDGECLRPCCDIAVTRSSMSRSRLAKSWPAMGVSGRAARSEALVGKRARPCAREEESLCPSVLAVQAAPTAAAAPSRQTTRPCPENDPPRAPTLQTPHTPRPAYASAGPPAAGNLSFRHSQHRASTSV